MLLPDGSSGGGISFFKVWGVLLAAVYRCGYVCLVDSLSQSIIRLITSIDSNIPLPTASCLTFSPEGTFLAAGCIDSSLWVYDILAASVVDWMSFKKTVNSLVFHPNGARLFTAHSQTDGKTLLLFILIYYYYYCYCYCYYYYYYYYYVCYYYCYYYACYYSYYYYCSN